MVSTRRGVLSFKVGNRVVILKENGVLSTHFDNGGRNSECGDIGCEQFVFSLLRLVLGVHLLYHRQCEWTSQLVGVGRRGKYKKCL